MARSLGRNTTFGADSCLPFFSRSGFMGVDTCFIGYRITGCFTYVNEGRRALLYPLKKKSASDSVCRVQSTVSTTFLSSAMRRKLSMA